MQRRRTFLAWGAFALIAISPLIAAAASPLLQWREPVYIAAGFAGIAAMIALLAQPLLAAGLLPGLNMTRSRHLHRWIGPLFVIALLIHVGGLWVTSPPDVIDALTFRSPTPFAAWGVIAMWAAFLAASLAATRRKLAPWFWRVGHSSLVVVVVLGTVVHAVLIDGTMESITKIVLSIAVMAATGFALYRLKPWKLLIRKRSHG